MISGYLLGDRELVRSLNAMPASIRRSVERTVQRLGFMLQAYVQTDKLSGQVLRVRTGRLKASVNPVQAKQLGDSRSRLEANTDSVFYYVGTNVSYGAGFELGTKAHDIVPIKGKALKFTIGGVTFFRRKVHMPAQPPRPFLAPALEEKRPVIIEQLGKALKDGMQESLK